MTVHENLIGNMTDPRKVSVILPAYNMADYLGEAVQGILNQTYQNLELIVVNDASTDHTDQVMRQFKDPRIKYIVHPENRYAAAARNTGIRASEGGYIAFIDADDKVRPEKLATQVEFLEHNPEIGLAYCSRIEIDQDGIPLALVPAPPTVLLRDLVMGFPYAPSEVVMRREWISRVGSFDESFRFSGEDPDFHMRLALHGCKMAGVRHVLNYRRLHAGRIRRSLRFVAADGIRAFQNTFASPLCPAEVIALRGQSLGMLYRIFSYMAFLQHDANLGQELLRRAIELDKPFFSSDLSTFIQFISRSSVRTGSNHEAIINSIHSQLPSEIGWEDHHTKLAIGYGYLMRWERDFFWDRVDSGSEKFEKALLYGVVPDETFLNQMTGHLLDYEGEFGMEAAREVFELFIFHLTKSGKPAIGRKLKGIYMINRAFRDYKTGEHAKVIPSTIHAIGSDPSYLLNRGVLSMLLRSASGILNG